MQRKPILMEFGLRQTVWTRDGNKWLQGVIVGLSLMSEIFEVRVDGCLDSDGNFQRHYGVEYVKPITVTKNKLFVNNPITVNA